MGIRALLHGRDQGGGQKDLLHVVIGKKRLAGGEHVQIGIYRGWYELDRLMKLFCVSRCVVDGLPNQGNARKFAARHKPRVFSPTSRTHKKARIGGKNRNSLSTRTGPKTWTPLTRRSRGEKSFSRGETWILSRSSPGIATRLPSSSKKTKRPDRGVTSTSG
jgi:hypothetical protein